MKKLRIAMIGAGNIANTHLEAYAHIENAEIAAICDINPKRLAETADRFGITNRYASVDEMLASEKNLDAADVCVWNCNHAECAIKALNAGLHTLCEKPMAYNAKQAEEMLEASKKTGKLLMIGFVLRFFDETKIAKDFIDKDYLGEIYFTEALYVRRHGNPGGWFSNKELSGGGPIIDLGVHVIDQTRYLMGNPKPVSVYAASYKKLGRRDYLKTHVGWSPKDASPSDPDTVEDFATAIIRYDNGATTLLKTSYSLNGLEDGSKRLFGTKGGMDLSSGVKIYTEMNDFLADVKIETERYKSGEDGFTAEMRHFVECALGNCECMAPAEDGIEIMKILDAIYESARTGHEVVLN